MEIIIMLPQARGITAAGKRRGIFYAKLHLFEIINLMFLNIL